MMTEREIPKMREIVCYPLAIVKSVKFKPPSPAPPINSPVSTPRKGWAA